MNMTITDSDKKLLSYLAVFLLAMGFFFLAFRPLFKANQNIEETIREDRMITEQAKQQQLDTETMKQEQSNAVDELTAATADFYPVMQSQNVEKLVTDLLLQYGDQIQSLTVAMPERSSEIDWYQYAKDANGASTEQMTDQTTTEQTTQQTTNAKFHVFVARVSCIVDGTHASLAQLVNTISKDYPAISISGLEWSSTERITSVPVQETATNTSNEANDNQAAEEGTEGEASVPAEEVTQPVTTSVQQVDKLTLNLEIYMCVKNITG